MFPKRKNMKKRTNKNIKKRLHIEEMQPWSSLGFQDEGLRIRNERRAGAAKAVPPNPDI